MQPDALLSSRLAKRAPRATGSAVLAGTLLLGALVLNVRAADEKPAGTAAAKSSAQLLDEFRRDYAMGDDQIVKRIPPPFSAGRMEYYRVHEAQQAKYLPAGPDYFWFRWGDAKANAPEDTRRLGKLHSGGIGWTEGDGMTVDGLINSFTGIRKYEIQGNKELLPTVVRGDWIIRDDTPPEKMLEALQALLQKECKIRIRFRLGPQNRRVIVATGDYAFNPLTGNDRYFDEAWVRYDRIDLYEEDHTIFEKNGAGVQEGGAAGLPGLFSMVSTLLNRPVVNEVGRLPKDPLCCRWLQSRMRDAYAGRELDADAMLKHLSEQTGLTFTQDVRRVRTLLIEAAE